MIRLNREPRSFWNRREPKPLPPLDPTPLDLSGEDAADNVVQWANTYIYNAVTPRDKLSGFMTLAEVAVSNPALCRLLGNDEGNLYEIITQIDAPITPQAVSVIDQLHAVARKFWVKYSDKGETQEDLERVKRKLRERVSGFKRDPNDTSADRSALEAVVVGDASLVLMRIDIQESDFDDHNS